MTKFETVGSNLQIEADTIRQAIKRFHYSCTLCAERGIHVSCDNCAIRSAHQLRVAILNDLAEMEREKEEKSTKVSTSNSI
mgnify:FL=1